MTRARHDWFLRREDEVDRIPAERDPVRPTCARARSSVSMYRSGNLAGNGRGSGAWPTERHGALTIPKEANGRTRAIRVRV